jgi:hypothetical protein
MVGCGVAVDEASVTIEPATVDVGVNAAAWALFSLPDESEKSPSSPAISVITNPTATQAQTIPVNFRSIPSHLPLMPANCRFRTP